MKKSDLPPGTQFKVGDRIVFAADSIDDKGNIYYNQNDNIPCGIVTSIKDTGSIVVRWDPEFFWMTTKTFKPNKLMLESEFEPKFSQLEAEFKALENKVKAKTEKAGKLLLEADKIARDAGSNINLMWNALAPLTKAMKELGWRTSSLQC